MRSLGLNALMVNFSSGGGAWYRSRWLPPVRGGGSVDADRLFAEARKAGIAVHGKRICMFLYQSDDAAIDKARREGRLQRGPGGGEVRQGRFPWLCPTDPRNRRLECETAAEIAARYPVTVIQLDYIRYPDDPACFCDGCRRRFEAALGRGVARWPADVRPGGRDEDTWLRWRANRITSLIGEIRQSVREANPRAAVTATCFRDLDRAYKQYGQDVRAWARTGVVDAVIPMNYEIDPSRLEPLLRRQRATTGGRTRLICGLGPYRLDHWRQLADQIELCRRNGVRDFALFAYDEGFTKKFSPALRAR